MLRFFLIFTFVCSLYIMPGNAVPNMQLSSTAFHANKAIPVQYTGQGKDVSPPLAWTNIPQKTQSLALICEDPDAPSGNWIHWILYNIPPTLSHIDEAGENLLPPPSVGKNSFGNTAYNGPNPPPGATHHYHFTLYALDVHLDIKKIPTLEDLHQFMK